MERDFCECKNCDAPIGRSVNQRTQTGKSHLRPDVELPDGLASPSQDTAGAGDPEDQTLPRLPSTELRNEDGEQIEFSIRRVLTINDPPGATATPFQDQHQRGGIGHSPSPSPSELRQLRAEVQSQRDEIKRIESNGFRIATMLDKRVGRIEDEIMKLKFSLVGLDRRFGRFEKDLQSLKVQTDEARRPRKNDVPLEALDDRLNSLSKALKEAEQQVEALSARFSQNISKLKSELGRQGQALGKLTSEPRESATAAKHTRDTADFHVKVSTWRRELEEVRARRAERARTAIRREESDSLAGNTARIGNRANNAETGELEREIRRRRLERAEARMRAFDGRRPTSPVDQGGLPRYLSTRRQGASPGRESAAASPRVSAASSSVWQRRYGTPATSSEPPTSVFREDRRGDGGTSVVQIPADGLKD